MRSFVKTDKTMGNESWILWEHSGNAYSGNKDTLHLRVSLPTGTWVDTSSLLGVMKAQQPEKKNNNNDKTQERKMVLGEHLKAQAFVKILWKIRGWASNQATAECRRERQDSCAEKHFLIPINAHSITHLSKKYIVSSQITQARSQIMPLASFILGHLILHLGNYCLYKRELKVIQCYLLKDLKERNVQTWVYKRPL